MLPILHVLFFNACLAAGMAVVVFAAQRVRRLRAHPRLWHAMWLLVLLKLVTPPVLSVPVFSVPAAVSEASAVTELPPDDRFAPALPLTDEALSFEADLVPPQGEAERTFLAATAGAILTWRFAVALSAIGTIGLLLIGLSRIRQIGRLVRHAEAAPQWMQDAAATAARQLGLRRVPHVRTVDGIVAPFLWAAPRGPVVVVPSRLAEALDADSVRLIVQHELAHYARRDHWTNTFSALLGVLFWWNPVVWWARRELRILQESCCDRMVLAPDSTQRHRYAETLLKTIDFVASDGAAFPTPATAFASCTTFKRRVEMIVSETAGRERSRWLWASVLLCAIVVLPVGLTYAQDTDRAKAHLENVEDELRALVEAGKLSIEDAKKKYAAAEERVKARIDAARGQRRPQVDRPQVDRPAAAARERLMNLRKQLAALVEAGKISEEDAKKKLAAAEKAIKARMAAGRGEGPAPGQVRERLARMREELGAAIKAGKISEEDAKKRYAAAEKAVAAAEKAAQERMAAARARGQGGEARGADRARAHLMELRKKLGALVEAGKISEEDAKQKLAAAARAIRERMGQQREDAAKKIDWDGIKRRIEGAVERGDITRKEADAKYKAIKEQMGQKREGAGRDIDWEAIKKRIEGAVKSGAITREEADAKYKAIKEQMGQKRAGAGADIDWAGIKKRIEGAVERGDITREQADAKYKEIKERIAGSRGR